MQVASDFISAREVLFTLNKFIGSIAVTEIKKLIRRRNFMWRRYKRSGSADHYLQHLIKLLRSRVVSLNRQLRNVYYSGLGEELNRSTKSEMVQNSEASHWCRDTRAIQL